MFKSSGIIPVQCETAHVFKAVISESCRVTGSSVTLLFVLANVDCSWERNCSLVFGHLRNLKSFIVAMSEDGKRSISSDTPQLKVYLSHGRVRL